jgi:DNA (cytosine-5)-methyltransferase 1
MLHVDLFAGIAGFSLACQWAGIETILFVEIDKYCQKVLRKHWPNVPIVEDIRDVEKIKGIVAYAYTGRYPSDLREALPKRRETIAYPQLGSRGKRGDTLLGEMPRNRGDYPTILITAGFPCQPFSVAGKRQGERDDRYLWPETLAVIKAVKPQWILLENVTGIINLALDQVLSDLEGAGYAYETLIIPACAVNAWHRRDRVWIVAHTQRTGTWQDNGRIWQRIGGTDRGQESVIANTSERRLEEYRDKAGCGRLLEQRQPGSSCQYNPGREGWAVEPELGRVAHGLPPGLVGYLENEPDIPRVAKGVKDRVNKLKALGNSIYWPVAYEIIKVIKGLQG